MLRHRSIVWFFDNEIDWVIQGRARLAVEAFLFGCLCDQEVFNVIKSVFKEKGRSDVSRSDRSQGE